MEGVSMSLETMAFVLGGLLVPRESLVVVLRSRNSSFRRLVAHRDW